MRAAISAGVAGGDTPGVTEVVEAVEAADAAAVSVPVPLDDVADADVVLRRWSRCIQ